MIIIGIDPGKTGAVAIKIHGSDWLVQDCPTVKTKVGKSVKDIPNPTLMADLLRPFSKGHCHVFLEKAQAARSKGRVQGGTSMFNFGTGYGVWLGAIAMAEMPVTLVTPQAWTKVMLPGKAKGDKQAGRVRALELFPHLAEELKLKKHDGRGDALCIGEYGWRSMSL